MSKHGLIDMIVVGKTKKVIYTQEDDDLSKEKANELIKNNKISKSKLLIIHTEIYLI